MNEITAEHIADEVLTWFESAWDPELPLVEWRTRLLESGWAVPSWPEHWYGRGLPVWADRVVSATIGGAGGVTTPLGSGMGLAAPTIVEHGSDDVKRRLLPGTITGELQWCQLFSEPGAGSDLAGLTTTAIRDGDDWIVNGQKVWNTSAHHADIGMLVARTDWDAPKHGGISYFAIPMHQEGVEVRPIKQMNYRASFNEVFLNDCRVSHENLIGGEGDGWRVTRATLMHERNFGATRRLNMPVGPWGRTVTEANAEAVEYLKTYEWYPQRAGRPDLLAPRAEATGRNTDAGVRQAITGAVMFRSVSEWTAARSKRSRELGHPPGPEGSLGKLAASELARRSHRAHTMMVGPDGMLGADGRDASHDLVAEVLLSTPAQSIAGGTDEIQHNIIGENILGLPREPAPDRGASFRDLPRNS